MADPEQWAGTRPGRVDQADALVGGRVVRPRRLIGGCVPRGLCGRQGLVELGAYVGQFCAGLLELAGQFRIGG
jgi:hypothetical protein